MAVYHKFCNYFSVLGRYISYPPSGDRHILIAGFFNVHKYLNKTDPCGDIQRQYGIMYVEAMLHAIDQINKNESFLFGNKLGARIFDYCGDKEHLKVQILAKIKYDVSGVVGPSDSDESMWMADVLSLWNKPLISYGATSQDIENRNKYPLLYRTVASDKKQVEVMIQLAERFNWTYIAFLYSYGSYGERAYSEFARGVENRTICIPIHHGYTKNADSSEHAEQFKRIVQFPKVNVVFMFLNKQDLRNAFKAASGNISLKNITFVGSEAWGASTEIISKTEKVVEGSLVFQKHSEEIEEFKNHFLSLRPENNTRNFWFEEFWEDLFQCNINETLRSLYSQQCNGNESLQSGTGYYPQTPIQTVINAVYAFAHVFRQVLREKCSESEISQGKCIWNYTEINQKDINAKLSSVQFEEPKRKRIISFDHWGSFEEDYDIFSIQRDENDNYSYQRVGIWRNIIDRTKIKVKVAGKLTLNESQIFWKGTRLKVPSSRCSSPCSPLQVTVFDKSLKCCWECRHCASNKIIKNHKCLSCPKSHVPDPTLRLCLKLEKIYLTLGHNVVTGLITCISIGSGITLAVIVLWIKNIRRRLVRASGRESCINMLIGIFLIYLTPILFIIKPNVYVCSVQRFAIGLNFNICYAPLFLKLVRVYRIFNSGKVKVRRPALIKPRSQILMSVGLSLIEVLMGLSSIKGIPPQVHTIYPSHRNHIVIRCQLDAYTVLFNLVYSSILMILATWYAFQTRNFPKNYNETKHIGITLYITCIIFAICLPSYFILNDHEGFDKILLLCFLCVAVATVSLFGFFGQKTLHIIRTDPSVDVQGTMSGTDTIQAAEETCEQQRTKTVTLKD